MGKKVKWNLKYFTLTVFVILEILMISLLFWDLSHSNSETTAKTIITYIFIAMYEISLFISISTLSLCRKQDENGITISLLYDNPKKEGIIAIIALLLSLLMNFYVAYIFIILPYFSPRILPFCIVFITFWMILILIKFSFLLKISSPSGIKTHPMK